MRIYLDNCCYNRPYDDQSQLSINLETQAKLQIQEDIKNNKYELVTSDILNYEVHNSPYTSHIRAIAEYIEDNSSLHVGAEWEEQINEKARGIMCTGVKYKDACHVASAIFAQCDYFISTDKRLLKYQTDEITMINPIEFIREQEEDYDR